MDKRHRVPEGVGLSDGTATIKTRASVLSLCSVWNPERSSIHVRHVARNGGAAKKGSGPARSQAGGSQQKDIPKTFILRRDQSGADNASLLVLTRS
ncbi:hypothetical protein BC938DRAFT_472727 [Jimgerdemannia flammicorona]|uniref:Uncharacterized protein n=1 Tax=Jimgerdemannia flammicorona TaxID=994334 RepID=A0A433Q5I6_9FUNG|nr:hypothetical protein BC938DRAFT_472727 [Jimgerdemannia flammicorona]